MALKLDNTLLDELGLGVLPEAEKQSMLKHIYETLEMRVGMRLADQMTNEQLDEFEKFVDANDDAGAFRWLETNFPNYKEVVNDEFEKLKVEVKQAAPQIVATSQQQAAQGPPPAAPLQDLQPYPNNPQQPPQYQQPSYPPQQPQPPQYPPAETGQPPHYPPQ